VAGGVEVYRGYKILRGSTGAVSVPGLGKRYAQYFKGWTEQSAVQKAKEAIDRQLAKPPAAPVNPEDIIRPLKDRAALHRALDAVMVKDSQYSAKELERGFLSMLKGAQSAQGSVAQKDHRAMLNQILTEYTDVYIHLDPRAQQKLTAPGVLRDRLRGLNKPAKDRAALHRALDAVMDAVVVEPGMLGINADKARALRRQLERKGFEYRFPVQPPTEEMVRHGFVKRHPYGGNEWKILNERKNGYHNITGVTAQGTIPSAE
jgi:hypothetical protein